MKLKPKGSPPPREMDGEANFKEMIRRFAQSASALRAFDAGQLDAFVDPSTGSAILLAEPPPALHRAAARSVGGGRQSSHVAERNRAERALQQSNRFARASLNQLTAYVCVLDAAGTVIMTNRAWRAFAAAGDGIGAGVSEGANYLAACDNAHGKEREKGIAIAAGIRKVIAGEYELFHHESVRATPEGRHRFAFVATGFPGESAVSVVISRGNATEEEHARRQLAAPLPVRPPAAAVNRLLSALPHDSYQRLVSAGLEPVTLRGGEVLFEPGERMSHVYFPNECVVSLLLPIMGHAATEVGLVGREGLVGLPVALGIGASAVLARVQSEGTAMRVASPAFRRELQQSLPLQRELNRFTYALTTQIMQTSACHRFHMLQQRLARMLLMTRDRVLSDELHLTHDFLADMLGVQRTGVTIAASALQHARLIAYSRGNIRILDNEGLKAAACSCYRPLGER